MDMKAETFHFLLFIALCSFTPSSAQTDHHHNHHMDTDVDPSLKPVVFFRQTTTTGKPTRWNDFHFSLPPFPHNRDDDDYDIDSFKIDESGDYEEDHMADGASTGNMMPTEGLTTTRTATTVAYLNNDGKHEHSHMNGRASCRTCGIWLMMLPICIALSLLFKPF